MNFEDKINVLEQIRTITSENAAAEDERENSLELFFPLRSYEGLRDPKKFLIVGGRGAGKTALFNVIKSHRGYKELLGNSRHLFSPKTDNPEFIVGYSNGGRLFPTADVCSKFSNADSNTLAYWEGSICFLLLAHYREDMQIQKIAKDHSAEFYTLFEDMKNLRTPSVWIPFIQNNPEIWSCFLDDVDAYLEEQDYWLFFVYDSLDRICNNYQELFPFIRTLLSFWFSRIHRWKRLSAKIFLRTDLLQSKYLNFVDASKLSGYRIELRWDSLSLYRMLVKRIANNGAEALRYAQDVPGLLLTEKQGELGYMPSDDETAFRLFMEKMIGKYMGKDPKRGLSYTWITNHIQDAKGIISPRPFLKCFVFASEAMLNHEKDLKTLEFDRLLAPSHIQGVLAKVSSTRVDELIEEYSWLEEMKSMLEGISMLISKKDLLKKINLKKWDGNKKKTLPGHSAEDLCSALEQLGIIYTARDGRINVPEIYLHGFGMKRGGGIKRPH